jgi:hypothetical protein
MLADIATCRATEKALLLDPCFDDPAEHLKFSKDGLCHRLTERGEATITVIGLNRADLVEARRQAWKDAVAQAQLLLTAVFSGQNSDGESYKLKLARFISGELPYTAVTRTALKELWTRLGRDHGIDIELTSDMQVPTVAANARTLESAFRAAAREVEASQPAAPEPVEPALPPPPTQYPGREALPPFAHKCIRRIEIRKFKAIEALDLDVPEGPGGEGDLAGCLMLLGENATGLIAPVWSANGWRVSRTCRWPCDQSLMPWPI